MKITEAYPLQWPTGFSRTKHPQTARFKANFIRARDGIISEIRLLGATMPIISSNIALRKDGLPYSGMAQPNDRGVAVYFNLKDQQRVLACDRWTKVEDNLRAIELAISALRGLDRWGCSQILERAFQGFTALPAPAMPKEWWDILECRRDSSMEAIEANYRRLAKDAHPDNGGSNERMSLLNKAIKEARAR